MTEKEAAILELLDALLSCQIGVKAFVGIVARLDGKGEIAGRAVSEVIQDLLGQ